MSTVMGSAGRSEPIAIEDLELDPIARFITTVAAASDIALRTTASTLLSAATVPSLFGPDQREDLDRLAFYAELAGRRDVEAAFVAPDGPPPDVQARRTSPLNAGRLRGRVEVLRFTSRYVPHHPDLRDDWARPRPNRTMWAQHWRHADGPRPTLLVCHGFMTSPYVVNSAFFSLPWFYSHGYDVALVVLPFHERRREPRFSYSGAGLFTAGMSRMNEGLFQAVHDIRSLINHLEAIGVPRVGMTGLSLGGYTTAMLAAAEPRLAFAIPNCAVADLHAVTGQWFPSSAVMRVVTDRDGADEATVAQALRAHSPLNYEPQIPWERRFIVHGLGDRLAPPSQATALWEHWGRPKVHWFPGNHSLHVNREAYLRRMGRFINRLGFGEGPGQPG